MGMMKEFKEFALRGNVFDLAVAVVIGTALTKIVTSLVDNVLMPPIGMAIGKVNFAQLSYVMARGADGKPTAEVKYGAFLQSVVDFVIIAFCVFLIVKALNMMMKKAPPPPPGPTREEVLLTEIRDLLRQQRA